MEKKNQVQKPTSKAISWAVFVATFEIVLITLISVVFPALIVRTVSPIAEVDIDPWEPGIWAFPLVMTNLIMLGIGIAYFTKKLPSKITKSIHFILNFEVSKKTAMFVIVAALGLYIGASIQELDEEEQWSDFAAVKEKVDSYSPEQVLQGFDIHVRWFLLWSSVTVFDNIRVVPLMASVSLLIVTYLITLEISKKRFAGLVALIILLQSQVFRAYDTTATYENFWTVLYILSLYLILKFWQASAFSFILSIVSKGLTALFLPMTFFFIYRAEIPRKHKIYSAISYSVIVVAGILAMTLFGLSFEGTGLVTVDFADLYFWQGFTSMAYQLRYDVIVLFFLLPLIVGLFFAARRGILQAESIMVLISGLLLISALLTGFTEVTSQPYRYVPLVVFFAMGVGTILSKKPEIIKK